MILVVLALVIIIYQATKAFLDPLKAIPGPFWARFTRAWYLRKVWHGDFEKTNIALHEKYGTHPVDTAPQADCCGPIVRIAPGQYSLKDPESLKTIYGHGTSFTKGPWYAASGSADPNTHDLFTDRDAKRHGDNRKKVARLYSMTSLLDYEHHVTELTKKMVAKFKDLASVGSDSDLGIDMQHWLQCFAFDMIGLITVGAPFGYIDRPEDSHTMFSALHAYLFYSANVGVYAEFHSFLSRFTALVNGSGMSYMLGFTQTQIAKHETHNEKAPAASQVNTSTSTDFLTKLLQIKQEQPRKISDEDVFGACLTNIGAGSDTTSISLSGILYWLIINPRAHQRLTFASFHVQLQKELDEKAAKGEISSPITFLEAQSLPYLQACIKEGLRLHPATGLPLSRVVPKGGATLCKWFVPEGTIVGVNTWVMHRNKVVFGDDADDFVPERWLEDPERASHMDRFFMTFGLGSRTCIGKNISLMEISKLVPELIRYFDFRLAKPNEKLETQNVWFVKQKNFRCVVSLRKE
ncbi:hypothetical protein LTR84_001298 [Exophiala bonariae]|uniref:Cytochrome P450 oxidoreductase n=1 Tax=Exophiala bonariae TaxID=1690606 RepID=A0AAV9NFR6_9EURO|nr:hypothetical protein LTR84_001298 [Exophiala bonariae]